MSKSKEARGWLLLFSLVAWSCVAADYRTRNFTVHAPNAEIAKQVGDAAEIFRRDLAIQWVGHALPPWSAKCPIYVKVGQIGAGGQTSFQFEPDPKSGEMHVFGWNMSIQGSLERILDSVLPHEITHTILACHFRCPLPRWADEGAATLAEHESEKMRQVHHVQEVLNTQHRIPLRKLVAIKDYPKDMRDVLTLYAEGYSVAELLVQKGGKGKYLKFLGEAMKKGWDQSFKKYYNYKTVEQFEQAWQGWVIAGSPDINAKDTAIASNDYTAPVPPPAATVARNSVRERKIIARGQGPDDSFNADNATASRELPAGRSDLMAPSPRSRIRRLPTNVNEGEASESPRGSGLASLGDDVTTESRNNHALAATESLDEPAGSKRLPAEANPGWSTVDESAKAAGESRDEAAPAPAPAYRRNQPRRDVLDETALTAAIPDDLENDATSPRNKDREVAVAEQPSNAKTISLPRSRKRTAPQWSEFPQISRPSPFTDSPAGR